MAEPSKRAETEKKLFQLECRSTKLDQYNSLVAAKKYWTASLALRVCAEQLDDPELKHLVADAEIKSHRQDIEDPKTALADRIRFIEMLSRDYPEEGKRYATQLVKLNAQSNAAETRRRRSEGVQIGMTGDEVLASSWGKPRDVNRTTYSWGTHEQWVYGGNNYLYFKNGKLDAIQN